MLDYSNLAKSLKLKIVNNNEIESKQEKQKELKKLHKLKPISLKPNENNLIKDEETKTPEQDEPIEEAPYKTPEEKPHVKDSSVKLISANQLMRYQPEERDWLIKDFLTLGGMAVLAGPPKIGKSIFAMSLALDISLGKKALGKFETIQYSILYISLEETKNDLIIRLGYMLENRDVNRIQQINIFFLDKNEIDSLDDWAEYELEDILFKNPEIKLVIIDSLGLTMNSTSNLGSTSFLKDYQFMNRARQVALDNNICIFAIHHTRKMTSSNPNDRILGSRGTQAAPDTLFVLEDKNPMTQRAKLFVSGRSIRENVYEVMLNGDTLEWELTNENVFEENVTPERKEILEIFLKNPDKDLKSLFVAKELNKSHPNVTQMITKLVKEGYLKKGSNFGTYRLPKK